MGHNPHDVDAADKREIRKMGSRDFVCLVWRGVALRRRPPLIGVNLGGSIPVARGCQLRVGSRSSSGGGRFIINILVRASYSRELRLPPQTLQNHLFWESRLLSPGK